MADEHSPGAEPATAQRQIERDDLDEIITAAETEHGALTAEEIEAKWQLLGRLRD